MIHTLLIASLRCSLFLAAVLGCSTLAFPQAIEHREWEASAFAGGSFAGDYHFLTRVSGSDPSAARTVGIHYVPGYNIGTRVNQNLGDFWNASLEYSFAGQNLRFTNLAPNVQSLTLSQYVHSFSYSVSYLPFVRGKRFRPYGSVGAGASLFYIPGSSITAAMEQGVNLRDSWEFVVKWGGGFEYLIEDQFAVTFDANDRVSRVPTYGLPHAASIVAGQYQPGVAVSGQLHNWSFNLGLTFQWDE